MGRTAAAEFMNMPTTILGRTGLKVSIIGLGAGTRFGSLTGEDLPQARRLLETALNNGITLIDTAAIYNQSEEILGSLLQGRDRDSYALNSKYFPTDENQNPVSPEQVRKSVERSLKLLKTDHLDVLQLHGVRPKTYRTIADNHYDVLTQLKSEGKFRFLGITETIRFDPQHEMMPMALKDDLFDTAMVAYNFLSPDLENEILPKCLEQNIGVIGMTAVRPTLSDSQLLNAFISKAKSEGRISQDALPDQDPLDWLLDERTPSLETAGYSYVLAEPAVNTVLSGTTNPTHLLENIRSVLGGTLSEEKRLRLQSIFRTPPNHDPWSTYDL